MNVTSDQDASTVERATLLSLGWARLGIGAAMMLAPRLFLRRSLLARDPDPSTVALLRGFGARDAALGAGILWAQRSADSGAARRWFLVGAGCDAADALAMVRGKGVPAAGRVTWALAAASAAAAGVAAAQRAR